MSTTDSGVSDSKARLYLNSHKVREEPGKGLAAMEAQHVAIRADGFPPAQQI